MGNLLSDDAITVLIFVKISLKIETTGKRRVPTCKKKNDVGNFNLMIVFLKIIHLIFGWI